MYIGETDQSLKARISEHKGYKRTHKLNQPIGEYFYLRGHTLEDLKLKILEKVKSPVEQYRKEGENILYQNSTHSTGALTRLPDHQLFCISYLHFVSHI